MRHACVPLLALLALFGGCALVPFGEEGREHANPQSFEAQGRVYVRFGGRAFSGTLRWRHDASVDEVWLGGPLGQTAAHIVGDSMGAVLTTADQQTYRARTIESLTRDGLGWSLPLVDLSYYVVDKVPTAAEGATERDARARPLRTQNAGWLVQWTRPEAAAETDTLPRLNLTKEDVEIRLVIDRIGSGD